MRRFAFLLFVAIVLFVSCNPEHVCSFDPITQQCECGAIREGVVAYEGSSYNQATARYVSLQTAMDSVQSGSVIHCCADYVDCQSLSFNNVSVELDLAGAQLSVASGISVNGGSVVVGGGRIIVDNCPVFTVRNGNLSTLVDFSGSIDVDAVSELTIESGTVKITGVMAGDNDSKNITLKSDKIEIAPSAVAQLSSHISESSTAQPTVAGHTHEYVKDTSYVKVPTCSEEGAEKYVCSCGLVYYTVLEKDPNNHVFDKHVASEEYLSIPATCQSKAVYFASCVCGQKGLDVFEYGEFASHTYDQKVATKEYACGEMNCMETNQFFYSCICGAKGTETFEAVGLGYHVPSFVYTIDNDSHWKECQNCGCKIDVESHVLTAGTVVVLPGCTTSGLEEGCVCQICEAVVSRSINPLGHAYNLTDWECDELYHYHICTRAGCEKTTIKTPHSISPRDIYEAPTCTENGYQITGICTECSYEIVVEIPATGHSLPEECTVVTQVTCTEQGLEKYVCQTCHEDVYKTIPALGFEHNWVLMEEVQPTCEMAGYKKYKCSLCNDEYVENTSPGHNVGTDGICTICGYMIGPAGGIIFYDCDADNETGNADGLISTECGWRYLEAAPGDLKVGNTTGFVFGFYRTSQDGINLYVNGSTSYTAGTFDPNDGNSTGTAIGTGKANTAKLVKAMGSAAYTTESGKATTDQYAAKLANDYVCNGYDDWFLPSKDELKLMYTYMHQEGHGGFASDSYWCSSEYYNGANLVWREWFSYSGSYYNGGRETNYAVRCVRAF